MKRRLNVRLASKIILIILAISIGVIAWEIYKVGIITPFISNDGKEQRQLAENNPVSQGDQSQNSDGLPDWKTYRNEKYGFEIRIPQDFKVVEVCGGINEATRGESCSGLDIFAENRDSSAIQRSIHIDVITNNTGLPIEELVKESLDRSDVTDIQKSKVNGRNVITVQTKGSVTLGSIQELLEERTLIKFISLEKGKVLYARYAVESCATMRDGRIYQIPCEPLDTHIYNKVISFLGIL